MILVTGGAGFIGSCFVLDWLAESAEPVLNLDKLTYAGNPENLASLAGDARHHWAHGDIGDAALVTGLLRTHKPRAVVHFAAESHVDRSIHSAEDFVQTNVVGTSRLLDAVRDYWSGLESEQHNGFRFLHVSTDEVFGSLGPADPAFTETHPYQPNSPYSASKAGSDHLVRAAHHTHGLPTLTTHCSNNYGPRQFPEKLIPLMILHALEGKPLPIYGDGKNVRDWLYVSDHCSALRAVLARGTPGEVYAIGGNAEKTNLEVVHALTDLLDEMVPESPCRPHAGLIARVQDRPGHDRRYAINAEKIRAQLGWVPQESFESGLRRTVQWYLNHPEWVRKVTSGEYRQWLQTQYQPENQAL